MTSSLFLYNPNGPKMPSRKSLPSDLTPSSDSRRSSMKRLSSIASLAHLNPFHRRRSNNASDSITSISSDVSLPSASTTTVTAPSSCKPSASESSSMLAPDKAPLVAPAMPIESQASLLRRSSYICIPDDPIGGMPRSRTFSNLPLPTRHRKSETCTSSDMRPRNPSNLTPVTRLPTPPISTRKHLKGNVPVAASRYQGVRNRMNRSDTMPLLPLNSGQMSNLPRPTAFKENISLSPVKPLPELEPFNENDFSSPLPVGSYMEDQLWDQTPSTILPRDPSFRGTSPLAAYSSDSPIRERLNFHSSPTYQSKQRNPSRSGSFSRSVPVQRWNSQPVLSQSTNVRANGHHEIRQTRLLSARQAPTPPLSNTPISVQALGAPATRVRGNSVSSSVHRLRRSSTQTLLNMSATGQPSAGYVSTAEPTAYWCGRMSSLLDRYRNEDLATALSKASSKSESDKYHSLEANTARMRRALEYLHSVCVTEEAMESFITFQKQYASVQNLPELRRPIKTRRLIVTPKTCNTVPQDAGTALGGISILDHAGVAKSEHRKVSLLNRMLRRREKRESHG